MPKLTDTQPVILSAAAKRDGGPVLSLPRKLKLNAGSSASILKGLLKRGPASEIPAALNGAIWRRVDGERLTLVISDAGFAALGIDRSEPAAPADGPARAEAEPAKPSRARRGKRTPRTRVGTRSGTKIDLLVGLLERQNGATIAEASEATEWQAHSVRGAISGTLKKKLGLDVTSKKVEDRGRVYRIAGRD